MTAAFAQCFGHLFLGAAEFIHKLAEAQCFFNRVKVFALDVFNDRYFQNF